MEENKYAKPEGLQESPEYTWDDYVKEHQQYWQKQKEALESPQAQENYGLQLYDENGKDLGGTMWWKGSDNPIGQTGFYNPNTGLYEFLTGDEEKDKKLIEEAYTPQLEIKDNGIVFHGTQETLDSDYVKELKEAINDTFQYRDLSSPDVQKAIEEINNDIRRQIREQIDSGFFGEDYKLFGDYKHLEEVAGSTNMMTLQGDNNKVAGRLRDGTIAYKLPSEWVEYYMSEYGTDDRSALYNESLKNMLDGSDDIYMDTPFVIMSGGTTRDKLRDILLARQQRQEGNESLEGTDKFASDVIGKIEGVWEAVTGIPGISPAYGFTLPEHIKAAGGALLNEGSAKLIEGGTLWAERLGTFLSNPAGALRERTLQKHAKTLGLENITSDQVPWMSEEDYNTKVQSIIGKKFDELTDDEKRFIITTTSDKMADTREGALRNIFADENGVIDDNGFNQVSYQDYINARDNLSTNEKVREWQTNAELGITNPRKELLQDAIDKNALTLSTGTLAGTFAGTIARFMAESSIITMLTGGAINPSRISDKLAQSIVGVAGAGSMTSNFAMGIYKALNSPVGRFLLELAMEVPEDIIQTAIDNAVTDNLEENKTLLTPESIADNTLTNLVFKLIFETFSHGVQLTKDLADKFGGHDIGNGDLGKKIRVEVSKTEALQQAYNEGRIAGVTADGNIIIDAPKDVADPENPMNAPVIDGEIVDLDNIKVSNFRNIKPSDDMSQFFSDLYTTYADEHFGKTQRYVDEINPAPIEPIEVTADTPVDVSVDVESINSNYAQAKIEEIIDQAPTFDSAMQDLAVIVSEEDSGLVKRRQEIKAGSDESIKDFGTMTQITSLSKELSDNGIDGLRKSFNDVAGETYAQKAKRLGLSKGAKKAISSTIADMGSDSTTYLDIYDLLPEKYKFDSKDLSKENLLALKTIIEDADRSFDYAGKLDSRKDFRVSAINWFIESEGGQAMTSEKLVDYGSIPNQNKAYDKMVKYIKQSNDVTMLGKANKKQINKATASKPGFLDSSDVSMTSFHILPQNPAIASTASAGFIDGDASSYLHSNPLLTYIVAKFFKEAPEDRVKNAFVTALDLVDDEKFRNAGNADDGSDVEKVWSDIKEKFNTERAPAIKKEIKKLEKGLSGNIVDGNKYNPSAKWINDEGYSQFIEEMLEENTDIPEGVRNTLMTITQPSGKIDMLNYNLRKESVTDPKMQALTAVQYNFPEEPTRPFILVDPRTDKILGISPEELNSLTYEQQTKYRLMRAISDSGGEDTLKKTLLQNGMDSSLLDGELLTGKTLRAPTDNMMRYMTIGELHNILADIVAPYMSRGNYKLKSNMIFYRGITKDGLDWPTQVGSSFHENGAPFTSLSSTIPKRYSGWGEDADNAHIFRIIVPEGTDVYAFDKDGSGATDGGAVVLPFDTDGIVIDTEQADGGTYSTVLVLPNEFQSSNISAAKQKLYEDYGSWLNENVAPMEWDARLREFASESELIKESAKQDDYLKPEDDFANMLDNYFKKNQRNKGENDGK